MIVAASTTTVERPRLARLRLAEDEDGGVERGDGRVAVARAEVRHADEAERLEAAWQQQLADERGGGGLKVGAASLCLLYTSPSPRD